MMRLNLDEIPPKFQGDIRRAVQILKDSGCKEIYLFGSIAKGKSSDHSDIDLAVRGCDPGGFFYLYGKLLLELEHPIHLINLDQNDPFVQYLQTEGDMVSVY